jgi:hypothetical protein
MFSCTDLVYDFGNVNNCCFNDTDKNIFNLCQNNIVDICDKFSNGNFYHDSGDNITFFIAGLSASAVVFTCVFLRCKFKNRDYENLDDDNNNDVFIN